MKRTGVLFVMLTLAVAGCSKSNKPAPINYYSPTGGPDPYQTQVFKPLEMPSSFAALPSPLSTGPNRADMARQIPVVSQTITREQSAPNADPSDIVPLKQAKAPSRIGGLFNWVRGKLSR